MALVYVGQVSNNGFTPIAFVGSFLMFLLKFQGWELLYAREFVSSFGLKIPFLPPIGVLLCNGTL